MTDGVSTLFSVLDVAMAIVLIVVLPVRGWAINRALDTRLGSDPREPMRTFRRSAVVKWSLTLIALVLLVRDGGLGLLLFGHPVAMLFPVALGIVLGAFFFRFRNIPDDEEFPIEQQLGRTAQLLPLTQSERRAWVGLSVTAGVTEEVLYRAFLVAYLYELGPALGLVGSAVLAGVAFGLVHAYQGWRGMALTAGIGLVLGLLYPFTGLVVLIILHTLVDLRVLLVPPDVIERARAAGRPH